MSNFSYQAYGLNASKGCSEYSKLSISTYFDIFISAFSIITFIIGVISWIVIKKFRCLKNYVLLNIIYNHIVNAVIRNTFIECIVSLLNKDHIDVFLYSNSFLYLFFKLTTNYWLLLLCYVFYSDLAKVYNSYITKRYLKCHLFAWGIPLLLVSALTIIPLCIKESTTVYTLPIYMTALFIPLVINFILYLLVMYSLIRQIDVNSSRVKEFRWRSIQMPTIIFFLSGVLMLIMPLQLKFKLEVLFMIIARLQDLSANLYFLMVSQNCLVWIEYFDRRRQMKRDIADIKFRKTNPPDLVAKGI